MVLWFFPFLNYVVQFSFQSYWLDLHKYNFYLGFLLHKHNTWFFGRARLPAGRQVCQFRHTGISKYIDHHNA